MMPMKQRWLWPKEKREIVKKTERKTKIKEETVQDPHSTRTPSSLSMSPPFSGLLFFSLSYYIHPEQKSIRALSGDHTKRINRPV